MENKTLTKENIEETEKNKNDNSSKVIENNLNNQNIKNFYISCYTCNNRNNLWNLLGFIWKKFYRN